MRFLACLNEKALVRRFSIVILSGSNALWPTQCTVTVTLCGPNQYCHILGPPKIRGMHYHDVLQLGNFYIDCIGGVWLLCLGGLTPLPPLLPFSFPPSPFPFPSPPLPSHFPFPSRIWRAPASLKIFFELQMLVGEF
jgi:hypothetical protein